MRMNGRGPRRWGNIRRINGINGSGYEAWPGKFGGVAMGMEFGFGRDMRWEGRARLAAWESLECTCLDRVCSWRRLLPIYLKDEAIEKFALCNMVKPAASQSIFDASVVLRYTVSSRSGSKVYTAVAELSPQNSLPMV
ncbi:hypothetical protein PSPO01_11024 [Paraphaeosphaeria sporulosa]